MGITTATVDHIHVGPGELVLTRVDDGSTVTVTFAATEDGGVLRIARNVEYVEAAEALNPLWGFITGEEVTFELNSIEVNAPILREALGMGIVTTTTPTAGVTGKDELAFGGICTLRESILQYRAKRRCEEDLYITIDLYRVIPTADIEQRYTKSGRVSYRVAFRALEDMTKDPGLRIGKITIETAAPTS